MRVARFSALALILAGSLFLVPSSTVQRTNASQHWSEIKLWASYWNTERGFNSTLEMNAPNPWNWHLAG